MTLIVGGSRKGADFTDLARTISMSSVENVICIGEEGGRIGELLNKLSARQKVVKGAGTMKEIVRQAVEIAKPGSVVLLSPAAASFDMFNNASDRGEQFKRAVPKSWF